MRHVQKQRNVREQAVIIQKAQHSVMKWAMQHVQKQRNVREQAVIIQKAKHLVMLTQTKTKYVTHVKTIYINTYLQKYQQYQQHVKQQEIKNTIHVTVANFLQMQKEKQLQQQKQ